MSDPLRAKDVFLEALEHDADERDAFLRAGCDGDEALAAEVRSLLSAHADAERCLSRPRPVELSAGSTVGPYRLVEPLGEGGFGVVWRARQEAPVRREVALKILRTGPDRGDATARFELERQALATLEHPGIAHVFDGGTEGGRPWFAMELVDGHEITAYVENAGLDVRARLRLFLDVCRAIQHAHQRGVIHRDVKPSNVLVHEVDGVPHVKVIDFGIARVDAELRGEWTRRTLTGQVLGTPSYMSPEQIVDTRDVDTRSDVYSLGVLLYELLVGAAPFEHAWLREQGVSDALRILREEDPPRPSTRALAIGGATAGRARDLRGELDWIVMRCLEKDRERRYSSVAGLMADVERHLAGEPVQAGPPSTFYRARKFARRHAVGLGALAAVVLALAVGATWATLEMRRARVAEAAEAEAAAQARLETERFQAIAEFFEHLLMSIDPAVARGRDVSFLREVLDNAATGIADRHDRPAVVEASLRRVIGGAYASLAEHERAVAQLEEALALRREALGPDAGPTIELQGELAGVLLRQGRLAEAEDPLRDALERARRVFGEDDERTQDLLANFAALLRTIGRTGEATELLLELERHRIATLGPDHEDTLLVRNNLALALDDAGRHEEAAERLEAIMEAQLAKHGERHPLALAAMGNYAGALEDVDRVAEAEELASRVLELKRELLTPGHPSLIVSLNNVASLLRRRGASAEALALNAEALETVQPGSTQQATLLLNRTDWLREAGRIEEALETGLAAHEAAIASAGPGSALARAAAERFARALLADGRPEEAEALAREVLEALADDPDADGRALSSAHLLLGEALAAQGSTDAARAELERARDAAPPGSDFESRARAALEAL